MIALAAVASGLLLRLCGSLDGALRRLATKAFLISWYKAYPGLDRTVNLVNNCLRCEMILDSLIYLTNVGF